MHPSKWNRYDQEALCVHFEDKQVFKRQIQPIQPQRQTKVYDSLNWKQFFFHSKNLVH